MQSKILTTNIELTDAIRDYLDKKLSQLDKYINTKDSVPIIEVELGKKPGDQNSGDNLFRAEINIEISGQLYRYVAEEAELYAAIDKMKDEIARIIRKDKEKKNDKSRRGALRMKDMILGLGRKK